LTNILSKNLNSETAVQNSISTQLCYGCNIIANEMTEIEEKFPKILLRKVDKNHIKEFLIDSDDEKV